MKKAMVTTLVLCTALTLFASAPASAACVPTNPANEKCDGLDNDCNGFLDAADTAAISGNLFKFDQPQCERQLGVCQGSKKTVAFCKNGAWNPCNTAIYGYWSGYTYQAGLESNGRSCDGLDNDCDGLTDEHFVSGTTTCGVGECQRIGTSACVAGNIVPANCTPGTPVAEVCNGLDDDCDGVVDNGSPCDDGNACTAEVCLGSAGCQVAPVACDDGDACTVDSCDPVLGCLHQATSCDDANACTVDACDPLVGCQHQVVGCDDGNACTIDSCDPVAGCQYAPVSCDDGNACTVDGCNPVVGCTSSPVVCNDDDDCTADSCDGETGSCVFAPIPNCGCTPTAQLDETCDNVDDDCDGLVDDDFQATETTCGTGACQANGQRTCEHGPACGPGTSTFVLAECEAAFGTQTPVCACLDAVTAGAPIPAQFCCTEFWMADPSGCEQWYAATITEPGACVKDSCQPGTPLTPSDLTCNDLDEDCDGLVDDDYQADSTCFLPGACSIENQASSCSAGLETPCQTGLPAFDDSVCNDADDDCDGAVDEDYAGGQTVCGQGVCAQTGQWVCQGGFEQNTCSEGQPTGLDDDCNGLDENCNGFVDESYATAPTACGQGVCASTGERVCLHGFVCGGAGFAPGGPALACVVDTCTEGQPDAVTDTSCDAADSDCDGQTDEEYAPVATTCGLGACKRSGATTCVGGLEGNTCQPGTPTAEVCNGSDDDCDGRTDAYDAADLLANDQRPCERQSGVCAGTTKPAGLCVSGKWKPCEIATYKAQRAFYATSDKTCDGRDNNCNGATDESYPVTQLTATCGTGICQAFAERRCVAGQVRDTCQPKAPQAEACNGLDDNCDGTTDGVLADAACDDENACTDDVCEPTGWNTATCTSVVTEGAACDDGDLCTLDDTCSADALCGGTPDPQSVCVGFDTWETEPGVGACVDVTCGTSFTFDLAGALPPGATPTSLYVQVNGVGVAGGSFFDVFVGDTLVQSGLGVDADVCGQAGVSTPAGFAFDFGAANGTVVTIVSATGLCLSDASVALGFSVAP